MLTWRAVAEVALGAVLPTAAASGAVFAPVARRAAAAGAAAGLAVGLLVGNRLRGVIGLTEDSADLHRLLYATGAVLIVGVVARWKRLPRGAAAGMRLLGAIGAAREITALAGDDAALTTWPLAALLFIGWVVCEAVPEGTPALAAAALAAGVVLLHAYSARLAEAAVLLAGALAGVGLVAAVKRCDGGGAVPGGVVLLVGLVTVGRATTFSEVPGACFVVVAAAPLALAGTLPATARRLCGPRLWLVRAAVVVVPLLIAVAIAHRAVPLE